MIELPQVTLFAFDNTPKIDATIQALYTSMQGIKFGAVKLVTSPKQIKKYQSELELDGIVLEEQVMDVNNYNDYNYYWIYKIGEHIETSHCLLIQSDGFVIFPHQWDDTWLEYDYIGAPWPLAEGCYLDPWGNPQRVGNGGFCLMSKKLLSVPNKVDVPWEINDSDFYKMPEGVRNYHGDGNVCCHNRHIYVEQGCKFAPLEVAVKFSHETRLPECENVIPFGFHFHLPSGVELEL